MRRPASADLLAKAACGLADDLLTTLLLSFTGPSLFAPAMNSAMWEKKSVQRNIATLRGDGFHFIDPQEGWQSCRRTGMGRMAEPADIQAAIEKLLEAQHESDVSIRSRPKRRFLAEKSLQVTCGQQCVDWAIGMLATRENRHFLLRLAGMLPPFNHFELAESTRPRVRRNWKSLQHVL